MKKKILAVLCTGMIAVLTLAGCGNRPLTGGSQPTDSQKSQPENSEEVQSTEATSSDAPRVVMYYPLSGIQADQDMVAEKVREYVMDKLGIDLELQVNPISSYDDQMNLVVAGSEQIDLALVWGENIASFSAKGALYPMDGLIDEYGQGIKESLGDYLNAGAINGVLYQTPVNRSMFYQGGVVLRKDILEKYNIDISSISSERDLDAVFETIKAGEPDMAMIQPENSGSAFIYSDFDSLGDGYGVLLDYGQNLEVVNYYATDEFKDLCVLHREWNQKGYISSDVLTNTESAADLVKAGKLLGFYVTVGPGTEQDKSNQCGRDMVMIPLRKPFTYTSKANGFGWSILNNTKDPVSAMKVLNLLYSDADFLNLIDWGIEGVHYKMKEGSDRIITFADGVDAATSGYFHNWSFAFGDQLNAYFWDGTEEDFPDAVRSLNKSAIQSKAMGFAYEVTPVKNEYTAVANVDNQYSAALSLGCIDPDENLPKFLEALENAGIDKIISEKQSQLDAWAEDSGVE
ncbi:MAG: ABC transporter substrate-binding protein [Lachnospiraceae bacterium]|nr:ABC transporter substrate-binding protein [Lachnospiraceae bacterium]